MNTHKPEGPKMLGSFKMLGVTKPSQMDAQTICFICGDTASKRRIANPCACELHRAWSR